MTAPRVTPEAWKKRVMRGPIHLGVAYCDLLARHEAVLDLLAEFLDVPRELLERRIEESVASRDPRADAERVKRLLDVVDEGR